MRENIIKKMPKVELHIHLEGTLDLPLIEQFCEKHQVALPCEKEKLFSFTGLADFLERLDWICALVRTPEDAKKIAYHYAQSATEQNIIYAEVITNPTHWKELAYSDLLPAILEGFDAAYSDGYCDCRLLVSLLRAQTKQESLQLVRWMKANRHPRLIGLSIDGNEAASHGSNRIFYEAFLEAKHAGFGITVHAGESSPSEGVWEALDLLGAMRIDHGVRSITDPILLQRLIDEQIPLNITLTSNLMELYDHAHNHPLGKLYQMGIPVTISTDDPELMDVTLCSELNLAAETFHWTISDLIKLQKNAIYASFCGEETKALLYQKLETFQKAECDAQALSCS